MIDVKELVKRLRMCSSDPMWADHCEISKRTVNAAADTIERQQEVMKQALTALGTGRIMALDRETGNYTREVTPKVITAAITALQGALEKKE